MLQKAANELFGGKSRGLELAGIGCAITKGDPAIVHIENAVIADGNAKDVGSQVLESEGSVADRFTMHDPIFMPHLWGNVGKAIAILQSIPKLGPEYPGKRFYGKQKGLGSWQPQFTVLVKSPARNQVVDVRVVTQIASPSVKHAHHTHLSADKTRVCAQCLHSLCRHAEQDIVNQLLISPSHVAQFIGQRKSDQKVWHRQENILLFLQPLVGLVVLTFGTMSVAAGMIQILALVTI